MEDWLVLDANAVAGELVELFGVEMTVVVHRCAHCGNTAAVGTLRAYTHGPGVVLRCAVCREVVLRWVWRPDGPRIDRSGAASMDVAT